MSGVYDVWFWLPFHILQAYPITRNLPLPDFCIPFFHMAWVPFYIWEHWAGLAEPVEEAWAMKSIINPMGLPFVLGFFYYSHKYSDHPTIVKVGMVLYFGFMFGKGMFGFTGSPKKTYDEQIAACSDPAWNSQHLFLHIWYLSIMWIVALSVPYNKLCAIRVEKSKAAYPETSTGGYSDIL